MMRLHRFIAQCGVCSRRKAEEMIADGMVKVNGKIVTEMGIQVGPDDKVEVRGEHIRLDDTTVLLLNKPAGYVTTMSDPEGRKTVMDLLPTQHRALKPVGRLDTNTEGLLLFTNDGDLAARLTHARYNIEKEYIALVSGMMTQSDFRKMKGGLHLDGKKVSPVHAEVIPSRTKKAQTKVRLLLHEGRYRQIRRMMEALGHPVMTLRRVRVGPLVVKGMAPGQCRLLSKVEINKLRSAVGLPPTGML